jgi:hypothetical protein
VRFREFFGATLVGGASGAKASDADSQEAGKLAKTVVWREFGRRVEWAHGSSSGTGRHASNGVFEDGDLPRELPGHATK